MNDLLRAKLAKRYKVEDLDLDRLVANRNEVERDRKQHEAAMPNLTDVEERTRAAKNIARFDGQIAELDVLIDLKREWLNGR